MTKFIDRRLNGRHKSAVNRQRFLHRFKKQIQDALKKTITKRGIQEIGNHSEKIHIPAKDIVEPSFRYGPGGTHHVVLPGNKEFVAGDIIHKPRSGVKSSDQSQASNSPDTGADDFVFEVSKDEFLELFFDDLALPNLIRKQVRQIPSVKTQRAGFVREGVPTNIHILRSMRGALGRKIALSAAKKSKIAALENERQLLEQSGNLSRIAEINQAIEALKEQINKIPYLDPIDLKYHYHIKKKVPATSAVMFCIMDVSGSMDETKKDIAKRFFILLYLFLKKNYESVEVQFIRHHTSAKAVDENEFFYSRETGGTVVSSALELMDNIITQEYPPSAWNIYVAQASDGDNWNNDSPRCRDILIDKIMPLVQYFAYVEIMPRHHQSLWEMYQNVKEQFKHFSMQHIESSQDIYPVFRKLFKKQNNKQESTP